MLTLHRFDQGQDGIRNQWIFLFDSSRNSGLSTSPWSLNHDQMNMDAATTIKVRLISAPDILFCLSLKCGCPVVTYITSKCSFSLGFGKQVLAVCVAVFVCMLRARCSLLVHRSDKLFHYPMLQSVLPIAFPYLTPLGPHTHMRRSARCPSHTAALIWGRGGAE